MNSLVIEFIRTVKQDEKLPQFVRVGFPAIVPLFFIVAGFLLGIGEAFYLQQMWGFTPPFLPTILIGIAGACALAEAILRLTDVVIRAKHQQSN